MNIKHFYHQDTGTLTYVVFEEKTRDSVIIDPVLDFDPSSVTLSNKSVSEVVDFIRSKELTVHAILETHAHADHLSGSQLLKQIFPGSKIGIGEKIKLIQETFKPLLNLEEMKTDGSQFDILFKDHEEYTFGNLKMRAIPTPGHTPACMSYLFGNDLFTGDALFMPDSGTGRCDFPNGSASTLYRSVIKNIYTLPEDTRIFVGHDYRPNGRELKFETTVGESKRENIHLKGDTSEEEYTNFRERRDATLAPPRLLKPSIQFNIQCGNLNRTKHATLPAGP